MGITNTKNNWLARMMGKDMTERKARQGNVQQTDPNAGIMPMLRHQQAQPQTVNPLLPQQPQAQTAVDQGATAPQDPKSKYKMYELLQNEPVRDEAQEGIIQRRAKMNAFSKGFSGLAGLAGVAMGGDAPVIPDTVTPFNMERIQTLDNDYKSRLEDWVNKGFQVDQANVGLQNKEIEQNIDQGNRELLAEQKFQNDQVLIEQRAQAAIQQFQQKSEIEQMQEMRELGINPNSPDATAQYLKKRGVMTDADIRYLQSKSNWNNRAGRSSGSGAEAKTYDIETLQRGKKQILSQLEQQKQGLDPMRDRVALEAIESQLKQIREYNPGKNELMDAEIMNAGMNTGEGGIQDEEQSIQEGFGNPYTPGKGMRIPKTDDPQRTARITTNLQKLVNQTATDEEFESILQDLVDAGEAADLDEAESILMNYLRPKQ